MDGHLFLPPENPVDPMTSYQHVTPEKSQNSSQPNPNADLELESLLGALPSCSLCRDRRVKCHQQLPACKECLRASRVCSIFDPVLGTNVPMRCAYLLLATNNRFLFFTNAYKFLQKNCLPC
jgi:hypothetical protein